MLTKEDIELFDQVLKKRFETEWVYTARLIIESEKRTNKKIEEAKKELREEIFASRAESKLDILDLGVKITKYNNNIKKRLKNLEDHTGTDDPTQN